MPWSEEREAIDLGMMASCRTVRPYQEPRTASADVECETSAFLEDWLKVLAWASICQRSGRMTTPDLATVV